MIGWLPYLKLVLFSINEIYMFITETIVIVLSIVNKVLVLCECVEFEFFHTYILCHPGVSITSNYDRFLRRQLTGKKKIANRTMDTCTFTEIGINSGGIGRENIKCFQSVIEKIHEGSQIH